MHIDTHNHFAVPEYINLLLNRSTFPYMERSGDDIIFHVSDMDTYTMPPECTGLRRASPTWMRRTWTCT